MAAVSGEVAATGAATPPAVLEAACQESPELLALVPEGAFPLVAFGAAAPGVAVAALGAALEAGAVVAGGAVRL